MKKKIIYYAMFVAVLLSPAACSDFLDTQPENILSDEEVFGDAVTIKSVLANFYNRVWWGDNVENWDIMRRIDDAARSSGGITDWRTFSDEESRTYEYELIRHINQFLAGVRATTALSDVEKAAIEGEARFIRAWTYFCTCRSLGGMPIVGDEVFEYKGGMDITALQYPRATEESMYRYIISECRAAAEMLPEDKNENSARANKWVAKMLEARAALYAGSIAKYGANTPEVRTTGGEVGIDAGKASEFYGIALAAAKEIINGSPYELQGIDIDADNLDAKRENFYRVVTVKENNNEVLWARDYKVPNKHHGFTQHNIPPVLKEEAQAGWLGVTLNLVEQYEVIDTIADARGKAHPIVSKEADDSPIFYDNASAPFDKRDPRLWGTVIYPGAKFRGKEIVLQAGQYYLDGTEWKSRVGTAGDRDGITSINGPVQSSAEFINKTGFFIRKYLDETAGSALIQRGSDVWSPRFRMSEAYLIAAEAAMETNAEDPLQYINAVRKRAGVKDLTSVTLDNIIHERRVEFPFEDHRWWDMRRWRQAHIAWDATDKARYRQLFPYLVVEPGNANDGKWVFEENYSYIHPNPREFKLQHYYCFLHSDWLNNNPKLVKNPYQN